MAQSTDPVISTIWKNKDIEPLGQYPPVSDFIFIELFLCSNITHVMIQHLTR